MTDSATFELRTYTATPGNLEALIARFRDHTDGIFARNNMPAIGYWVADDSDDTLIYVLRHSGDPKDNWAAFRVDPEWVAAKSESESRAGGPLTSNIDSRFMSATDFSASV